MAKKISDLTAETEFANTDSFVFVDQSAGVDKRITGDDLRNTVTGNPSNILALAGQSADPANPSAGNATIWVSDGTGSGAAGDVMSKINVAGTVKTVTLIDYSGA